MSKLEISFRINTWLGASVEFVVLHLLMFCQAIFCLMTSFPIIMLLHAHLVSPVFFYNYLRCYGLMWLQVPEFPSKLFFFCEVEPGSGGETPIVLSHIVYEKMKEKYPEFVDRLEAHGLLYNRVLGEDDDPSSPIGRGWKSTFLTSDKAVAEERSVISLLSNQWSRFDFDLVQSNPSVSLTISLDGKY